MNDTEISTSYIRYLLEGAEADSWAPIELNELAGSDPERAWKIVQRINATSIEGKEWREHVYAALGCGAIEELIVLHEETMLPLILKAAETDPILRLELSTIYKSSVKPHIWSQIQTVVAQQGAQPGRG